MTKLNYQGKVLSLMQTPYLALVQVFIDETNERIDGAVYRAVGTDRSGNIYHVYWTRLTAEHDVADWDAFSVLQVTGRPNR